MGAGDIRLMDRRNFLKHVPTVVVATTAGIVTKKSSAEEVPVTEPTEAQNRGEVIRLWKLGSIEHGIYPTDAEVQRLADILSCDGGPPTDIIWGPYLTCEVINTDGKTVYDVINTGKPTPEAIADKILELRVDVNDLFARDVIIQAIKEASQEAINAQSS